MEASPPLAPPASPAGVDPANGWRAHLGDPLYRTGYLLIIGAGVGSLLGFAFWVLAANLYSPRVVGLNSAAVSAMMLVSGICMLGLNAVLVRYLPSAGPLARRLIVRTYALTTALSLVLGSLAALTSELWSPELEFLGSDAGWLLGFVFATVFWTLFTLQDSVMTGLQAPQWVPLENSIFSAAKLLLLVPFSWVLSTAGPFAAWNTPLPVVVALITFLILRRLLPASRRKPAEGSLDRGQLIRAARGNYGGSLFFLAWTLFLPILVTNIESPADAAFFYAPWTIATGLQLIAINMSTSLTVEGALDEPRMGQLSRRALTHTLRLLLPLVAATVVAAPWILHAFGSAYAEEGSALLRLLAIGAIPNVLIAIGLAVARIEHKGRSVLVIQGAQCLLILGGSIVLLPPLGIDGIGVAWIASQTIVAGALLAGLLRKYILPRRSVLDA